MEKTKEVLHTQGELHRKELPCEVHKQRKSGIGNVGYGYAILQPFLNVEGEYKGQRGGYHVIASQDLGLSQKDAQRICDSINSCYHPLVEENKRILSLYQMLFDERPRLIDSNRELQNVIKTIEARITGEWDYPGLMDVGSLDVNIERDIIQIINNAKNNIQ